jgi:thiamine kinase-like enzyme
MKFTGKDKKNKVTLMDNHFLTNTRVLKGKFYNYLEIIFSKIQKKRFLKLNDYAFIKSFDKYSDKQFSNSIGLYRDKQTNNKVIIRRFCYRFKNLKLEQIINEYNIMKFLEKLSMTEKVNYQIIFPRLIKFTNINHEATLIREYLNGTQLKNKNNNTKVKIISMILNNFFLLSKQISKKDRKRLPIRSMSYIFLSFPIALIRSSIKNPNSIFYYFKLSIIFYFQFLDIKHKPNYVLAHRDLHSGNILIYKNMIQILDSEITVLAEEDTDIAIISRYYIDEIDQNSLIKFITSYLKDKKSFIRLAIFYSFQLIANESSKSYDYKQARKYLRSTLPVIIEKLYDKRSRINKLII